MGFAIADSWFYVNSVFCHCFDYRLEKSTDPEWHKCNHSWIWPRLQEILNNTSEHILLSSYTAEKTNQANAVRHLHVVSCISPYRSPKDEIPQFLYLVLAKHEFHLTGLKYCCHAVQNQPEDEGEDGFSEFGSQSTPGTASSKRSCIRNKLGYTSFHANSHSINK